jgi:hypothetical protein
MNAITNKSISWAADINHYRAALRAGHVMTMRQQCRMKPREAVTWQAALILEGKRDVLSTGNPKLAKARGVKNGGLTMSPAREATALLGMKMTLCAKATTACEAACVGAHTGQGRLNSSLIARQGRTVAWLLFRDEFEAVLVRAIKRMQRNRAGLPVAIRCNVATDLWMVAARIAKQCPGVDFYDYTAIPKAVRLTDGVHRVLSHKGPNLPEVLDAIRDGYGVAVVFDIAKTDAKPATWHGAPVINGDVDDLWHLRAPKSGPFVVGLYLKGMNVQKEQARAAGFAVAV